MTERSTDALSTEPERWSDRGSEGSGPERSAGRVGRVGSVGSVGGLLARVREATDPSSPALQRLALRRERSTRVANNLTTYHHRVWRMVMAAALLIAMGGAVGAALNSWVHVDVLRMLRLRGESDPDVARVVAPASGRGHHRLDLATRAPAMPPAAAEHAAAPPEAQAVLPSVDASARPETTPPVLPAPRAAPPRPVAPSLSGASAQPIVPPALAPVAPSEAEPLAAAFRTLRSGGDVAAALRLLDDYDQRFPGGVLRGEAAVARVEALLALRRDGEALRVLREVETSGGTLTRELRITRGELFATGGDCDKATQDFDVLVGGSKDDGVTARALVGRAGCRLRRGETAGARVDLQRYLILEPDGPSAAEARRVLQSLL